MVVKARLHSALARSKKRQADIARDVGVSTAAVAQWFHKHRPAKFKIKHENLVLLAQSLDVSVEWLDGRRQASGSATNNQLLADPGVGYISSAYASHVIIQSCDTDIDADTRVDMTIARNAIQEAGLQPDDLVSIVMPDDSQAERIYAGDMVAINRAWSGVFEQGKTYAIRIGGVYTLRRAILRTTGGVILRCRNAEKYPDEYISADEISSLDVLGEFFQFQSSAV